LGSANPAEQRTAQRELAALGPERIDEIRRATQSLDTLVRNYEVMRSNEAMTGDVHDAVRYFGSLGATQYLFMVLNLNSGHINTQGFAAEALANLEPAVKSEQKQSLVRHLVEFLDRQQVNAQGGEFYSAQIWIRGTLAKLVAELIGIDPPAGGPLQIGERTEEILRRAREWLGANGR
jgi:hypothetical protein